MKRRILRLTLVTCFILAVTALFTVSSSAATYGDLTYTVSNGEITITDCATSATSVTIPSKINGYSVTSIGDLAFYYCTNLTSVNIPDSVTSIGYSAFDNCSSLTSISIPDSVTSIGSQTFEDCTSLTSVNIPDSVTSIGDWAFYGCSSLTSVNIPDSVTSIGSRAFYDCTSLTSISIPDSVTSIGAYAFYSCTSLASISVDEGNRVYHSNGNCLIQTNSKTLISGCKNSVIPTDGSVTSIGEDAFYGCKSLTSISIPDSVTSIGDWAFSSCTSLASISIPDSVTSIGDAAFCNCTSLTSVNIPDSVTSIGSETFRYCKSLTSVNIPDSVTSIGDLAFSSCTRLTSISIPDSVTSIGYYAFYNCTSLKNVYYCGTAAKWNGISIGSDNTPLTSATRYYHKYISIITEPTCTKDGAKTEKCEFCDLTSEPEPIPALGHSWSDWGEKIAPTCSVSGFERRTCSACDSQENRIVSPRHTWGEWYVHAEPTCTDSGSRSRNCQSCGATETEELGILGHDEVKHAAQAPTCTSVGWHEYTACTRCGQNNYVEIPALGHFWEEWHTVIYPTADSVGFKERCCANCTDEEYDYVYFASGDVDGDGTLTNADLTIAVRAISGWTTDGVISQVDINYDGKINNRDIIVFIQKLAGRELVYRVDPSNIQNRIYTSVKYSEPSSTDEVSCVSLDLEQRITLFRGYLTCEIVYGEDECPGEEHFDYNGMSYHNVKGGADEWTNVEISDEYITISFADEVLKLELLSNDTLRVVEAVNSSEISAGDIFG